MTKYIIESRIAPRYIGEEEKIFWYCGYGLWTKWYGGVKKYDAENDAKADLNRILDNPHNHNKEYSIATLDEKRYFTEVLME